MDPHQRTASLLKTNHLSFRSPLVIAADDCDKDAVNYLQDLAEAAKHTAYAHACSSVLAGQSSEADDLDDIGFWLGEGQYDRDNAGNVMKALGLGCQFRLEPLSDSGLPAAFKGDGGEVVKLLKKLGCKYCVRLSIPGESIVVFVLVGRIGGDGGGWGGLVGAGVWSDGLSD